MDVFATVIAGVLVFVFGQLALKLAIDPVHEMRKTIGLISHALIEHASVIHRPGVGETSPINVTSKELRRLSSQLQSHLYLVPIFDNTAKVFRLPDRDKVLRASHALLTLSHQVFYANSKNNDTWVKEVCESLGIYLPDPTNWPTELDFAKDPD